MTKINDVGIWFDVYEYRGPGSPRRKFSDNSWICYALCRYYVRGDRVYLAPYLASELSAVFDKVQELWESSYEKIGQVQGYEGYS